MGAVSDELRAIVTDFYEHGSPEGARLEALIPRVEALEDAAECGGRPCVAEDGQENPGG